jgi:hypothetical protein
VTAYDGGDWNTDPGLVAKYGTQSCPWCGSGNVDGVIRHEDGCPVLVAAIGAIPTVPAPPPTPPTRTHVPNNPPEHHTDTLRPFLSDEDLLIECDALLSLVRYRESSGLSEQTIRDIDSLLGPLRRQTDQINDQRREASR